MQGIGVRAALGTALIRGIVQDIAPLGSEPGAYLARMNQLLDPMLCHTEFPLDVRACYLVIDVASGKIRMANAGHPTPIHIQQGHDVKWLFENKAQCGPALALQADATYQTIECAIDPGDGVVLFTDGLYTTTDSKGELYGEPRLLSSARSHSAESLADLFQSLEADACAFSSAGDFSDDVCLVGFQLNRLLG